MSFEAVDFYVTDSSPAKKPVSGVVVKVFSNDGKLVYSQVSTDTAGHAGFMLPSGLVYQARFYCFQMGFLNPQRFTVLPSPQTNSFNVTADVLTPPTPLDARLCTAYGFFRDITGAPQSNVDIHFIGKFDPVWLEGAAVVKERVIIRTDEKGYAQVNLIRNAQYDCTVQGEEDITRRISVPDAPNVNLPDLLFPIVAQVICTPPGPYVLTVGEELPVTVHIIASDGEDLGMAFGDVLWSTSNQSVVSYTCSPVGLVLQGVGAGSAQINVVRADQSIVHIPDPGVLNGALPVTVL